MSPHAPSEPGLPKPKTILREELFVPPHPTLGPLANEPERLKTYRILITNQVDAYDKPLPEAAAATLTEARDDTRNDQYSGTARKAAKITVAAADTEVFTDLKDLIGTLPTKQAMKNHKPKITDDAKSDRVKEEQRNVRVNAFLYAASREADNDYHLIIGRSKDANPFQCMNVEVSGLPPVISSSFNQLNTARNAFKDFFKDQLPGNSYSFYSPPIPVLVEGSLFFDVTHATGSQPGPKDLRPFIPTIWEIHPITSIRFEP